VSAPARAFLKVTTAETTSTLIKKSLSAKTFTAPSQELSEKGGDP